ncbi:hypothetical protein GCM10010112_11800 [Actinoplanes lobatus]|uniref:Uncharacterized protein n=1 Tax=Actinoplanes lobatus TaxID=113568 RepID=A0A7W7HDP6_9ACTN|nr:hypothetical protein [Actinoplanes lobatus]MBB4748645.1 hypothetical protein [Actinoplanes lobatus]GGN58197.1 hypothetical protein GCM10010112_11800 [Actinoplanes lobatus]GIE37454.1 hypothetical protein Alo02nite_03520 [Actinoplanes lobatus]
MVDVDEAAPADIVDRLLWRDAQRMLGRHVANGVDGLEGTCDWCGWRWPCSARRLAERAAAVARRPWREAWTLRHDLNSMRSLPGKRAGADEIGRYGAGPYHRNDDNRRYLA